MPEPKLTIVIPVYNSMKSLVELVLQIQDVATEANLTYEIIAVCDASPDGVWKVMQQIASGDPKFKAILLDTNYGQQGASLCGILNAQGEYIVTIDDDMEYNPKDIPLLLQAIEKANLHLVYGYAPRRNQSALRFIMSNVAKSILSMVAGVPAQISSFRIINRSVTNGLTKLNSNRFLIDALLKKRAIKLSYIEVEHHRRKYGKSNYTIKKLILLWLTFFYSSSIFGEVLTIILQVIGMTLLITGNFGLSIICNATALASIWQLYTTKWKKKDAYVIKESINL